MSAVSTSLRSIVGFLERWAPRELAESWDNVGLLVQPVTGGDTPVAGVMLTNDLTEPVLEEVLRAPGGVQLILSYHPLIFKGLTRITMDDWKGRIIAQCLTKGIAIYSPHTCWDNTEGGISDWLLSPLAVEEKIRETVNNSGRLCTLAKPLSLNEIVTRYKKFAQLEHVRLTIASNKTLDSTCESVAVCAGSGASVLGGSAGKCHLWVTGEMSHHELLNAQHSNTSVLLLEHSNSERSFLQHFKGILQKEFPSLNILVSKSDADPVSIV